MTLVRAPEPTAPEATDPESSANELHVAQRNVLVRARSRHLVALAVVAAVLPLLFWWFQSDDAAITFAFARSWAHGASLGVPVVGMLRVEGYSNFSWMALLALGAKAGLSIVFTAKLLAAAALAATSVLLARTLDASAKRLALWCCLPTTATVIWAASGLENSLRDLLLVGLGLALHRQATRPSTSAVDRRWVLVAAACSIGLVMTRPDALVSVAIAGALAVRAAWSCQVAARRREVIVLAVAVVVAIGLFTWWRLTYFGWAWPNTVYAKTPPGGFLPQLVDLVRVDSLGWNYLGHYLLGSGLLLALPAALLGAVRLVRRGYGPMLAVLVSPGIIAVANPDWMADGRFYTPLCWAIVWSAGWGIAPSASTWSSGRVVKRTSRWGAVAVAILLVVGLVVDARMGVRRWSDNLSQQVTRAAIAHNSGRFLGLADAAGLVQPMVFSPDAGAVLLDRTQLWLLDAAGLNDPILAHIGDVAARAEYLYALQRPEIIEVVAWSNFDKLLSTSQLRRHGYRPALHDDDTRPLWVGTSAALVGDDVTSLLSRLDAPSTPPCELAALARGVQHATRGRMPRSAAAVARSLSSRPGAEAAFAAVVLDPNSATLQRTLIDDLAGHRWSSCT